MNSGALELALVGLAGGGIGFVSGMFGIGGGFLIVPVLNIGLKVPIELAVGAGACQGLGPATTALLARRVSTADVRMPLTIAGGLFVTRSPAFPMVVEGPDENTWLLVRKLVGATKATEAEPGSIRGDFATITTENLVHASDGHESAACEIGLWFPGLA